MNAHQYLHILIRVLLSLAILGGLLWVALTGQLVGRLGQAEVERSTEGHQAPYRVTPLLWRGGADHLDRGCPSLA